MFDADNAHRWRSSLVTTDNPRLAKKSEERRQDTACFVHSLLEKKRNPRHPKDKNLQDINEGTAGDKTAGLNKDNATHSRLLTKRQLSDMAWGVRELSKRLGSVRLKLKVKTVFLLTKAHDEGLIGYTKEVVEWLLSNDRDVPYVVYVRCQDECYSACSYSIDTLKIHSNTITHSVHNVSFQKTLQGKVA